MIKYKIGIDVGGTTITGVLIKGKQILKKIKIDTEKKKGRKQVVKNIINSVNLLKKGIAKNKIKGIGIGFPGLVDKRKGRIIKCPNVCILDRTNIQKTIEKEFKLKCRIENDANCAAIAESKTRSKKNLVCLTIGTGVGGGIIINGVLYTGRGNGAELGHMIIDKQGKRCSCGNRGCLEAYISARAITGNSKIKDVKKMAEKARAGKGAKKNFLEMGKNLGAGLSNIVNIFDPEVIVLAGGITGAYDLFLEQAVKEMKKRTWFKPCPVKITKLGDYIGATGAGFLF